MSETQLSISLSVDLAEFVRNKVTSGEYTSESEVVQESLYHFLNRDRTLQEWLAGEVASAFDTLRSTPERAVSVAEVRASLTAEHSN